MKNEVYYSVSFAPILVRLQFTTLGPAWTDHEEYRVVPNGLLTFLGSLYKEVVKLLPELWYIASRDKPQVNIFLPSKSTELLSYNVGLYLRNLQRAAFGI